MRIVSDAVMRVLMPLAAMMIAKGVRYPFAAERLKEAFANVAARDFALDGKKPTMSRISILTGLQRKDIKQIRARMADGSIAVQPADTGVLPKLIARWRGLECYRLGDGELKPLPRFKNRNGVSFEELVAEIGRDVHPRTVLDELLRQKLAAFDPEKQLITLTTDAFLPHDDEPAKMSYWGRNIGDHAAAATANLEDDERPPFFERAAHYGGLSEASVSKLDSLARAEFDRALAKINEEALKLQAADRSTDSVTKRFRAGGYIFHEKEAAERS